MSSLRKKTSPITLKKQVDFYELTRTNSGSNKILKKSKPVRELPKHISEGEGRALYDETQRMKVRLYTDNIKKKYKTYKRSDGTESSLLQDQNMRNNDQDDLDIQKEDEDEQKRKALTDAEKAEQQEIRPAEQAFRKPRKSVYGRVTSKIKKLLQFNKTGKKGGKRSHKKRRTIKQK